MKEKAGQQSATSGTIESYAWWTDEQIKFAEEVEEFAQSLMPRDAETRWTREFPWDIYEEIGKRKYTGAAIPKEYVDFSIKLGQARGRLSNANLARMMAKSKMDRLLATGKL